MKPIILSVHAKTMVAERELDLAWVQRAANMPDWVSPDDDPELERRFKVLPERGGRIIRVVCRETNSDIYVVTVFLDRKARRPA